MIDVKEVIIEQLEVLPYERQCRVLGFTRRLVSGLRWVYRAGIPSASSALFR